MKSGQMTHADHWMHGLHRFNMHHRVSLKGVIDEWLIFIIRIVHPTCKLIAFT